MRFIREFDKRVVLYEKEIKEEIEVREKVEKEVVEVKVIYSFFDLLNFLVFLEIFFICIVGIEYGVFFLLFWLINVILCNIEFCFVIYS